jgi:hypothetical protein
MEHVIAFLQWLHKSGRFLAVYRGHDNFAYQLVPSAFRVGEIGITNQKQLNNWRSISGRVANPKPQTEVEWLVLAQHYGIPTGLLDWTTNPLTALFFACSKSPTADGCVIACDRSNFLVTARPERAKVFDEKREKPLLIDASPMNARTLAQDSMMSLHYGGFPSFGFGDQGAVYSVPMQSKASIIGALRQFGFTAERLYADLTTAAQQFQQSLRMEMALEAAFSSAASSRAAQSLRVGRTLPGTPFEDSSS